MPQKGLEKRGGVPSSPFRLRRDKLRRGKRTFPKKGFFPSSSNNLYWEQSFTVSPQAVSGHSEHQYIHILPFSGKD